MPCLYKKIWAVKKIGHKKGGEGDLAIYKYMTDAEKGTSQIPSKEEEGFGR